MLPLSFQPLLPPRLPSSFRRRYRLPDGGVLDVSEMDYHTAAGTRLEGAGLRPDVTVEPTREDLRHGRDRALERALEILQDAKERQ